MTRERTTGGRFKNSGSYIPDFPGGIDKVGGKDCSYDIHLEMGTPYRITPEMHAVIDFETETNSKRVPMSERMRGVDLVMAASIETMKKHIHDNPKIVWCDYCIFSNTRMCNRMRCTNIDSLAAYVDVENIRRNYHNEFAAMKKVEK